MSDRWFSEIELQKTHSLSPGESFCVIGAQNGLSSRELADIQGITQSAVNTMLQRARDKMKKNNKKVLVIIDKGNRDVPGHAVKQNAMRVLLEFMQKVTGISYYDADYWYVMDGLDESNPGDVQWLKTNVFRYVDLVGTTGGPDTLARAEKVYNKFVEAGGFTDKVGTAIIRYFCDQMYIKYKMISLDE